MNKKDSQNSSSGYMPYTVGTEELQPKAGTAEEKLDGHHQTIMAFNVWPNRPIIHHV